jgi:hypothetical protein
MAATIFVHRSNVNAFKVVAFQSELKGEQVRCDDQQAASTL